jgi:hypothetical protein
MQKISFDEKHVRAATVNDVRAIAEVHVAAPKFRRRTLFGRSYKILNSPPFLRSQRLRRFLTFLVDESLEGRGSQLKEYPIGVEVFDRRPDYDPQTDPTARVHAGKLRDRLRECYLTDGRQQGLNNPVGIRRFIL